MADEVTYDVFLSHNRQDKPQVEDLAQRLGKRGLVPFLDRWFLVPGEPWQEAIEEALRASASCAVFLGAGDISPWHNEEMRAALNRQARERTFRVIPVLLPGATRPDEEGLPLSLGGRTWVDFRQVGLEDAYAFHCLCCGIQGIAPGPPPEAEPEEAAAIPPVRALPPGSYMPLPPSADFVGRVEELRTLAGLLCDGGGTETVAVGQIVATGLGGIGKTQLAVAFVHRYGHRFHGGVFWLDCGDPELIPDFVAACGGLQGMNLPGFEALSRPEQIARVRAEWRKPIPRLLVLDNVEEVEVLRQWRPPSGGCRLLITSRRGDWPTWMGVQPLAVGTLPRPESLELLCRPQLSAGQRAETCPLYHDPAADELCELLDDLPLALHLAGCYLAHYGHEVSAAEYLEELRAAPLKHDSLRRAAGDVPSPTGHEQNVEATFQVSYGRLDADDPTDALARRLFVWAGHCAPGAPIPRELLRRAWPEETAEEKHLFADALRRLADLGLFQPAGNGDFQVHRLLAEFAQDVGAEEEAEVDGALAQAVAEMASEANQSGLPARMLPLLPHLRQAAVAADARGDQRTAWLYNELGYHLDTVADYAGARPYYERALAIHEKVLGREHPDTAGSLNNLGGLLQAMGDLAGARPYWERALAIWEKVLGGEHPHTANSLNNLGYLLYEMGDLAGARPYLERALAIREKVLGGEHPDTAASLNNLGLLLRAMGDLAGARPYLERALAICEKVLGGENPYTAASLNNVGSLLHRMGDLAGARPYYERALAIREKVLGAEHPDTAQSLNNLGFLLQAMGDLAGARPYYERALAIREKVLGGEHPDTANSLNNLGGLLQDMGDLAGARPYYERALAIREKALGAEHPSTALSLNNLGFLLQAMGDLAGARAHYERALAIFEKVLGGEHPNTVTVRGNLESLEG